jgi:hypothetical protein
MIMPFALSNTNEVRLLKHEVQSTYGACKSANKENQHGPLKALRQKHATLLPPSYLRRYTLYTERECAVRNKTSN